MKFSKDIWIFLSVFSFLTIGTVVATLTHQPKIEINLPGAVNMNDPKLFTGLPFDSNDHLEYIEQIRPIIASLGSDSSIEEIRNIKETLLEFKSQDPGIGKVHINLYLAFVDIEEYLLENDAQVKQKALDKLNLVSDWLPQLEEEINNLSKTLLNG